MGTTPSDCRSVARLIGLKTFTNEFVAYDQLGKIINNKKVFLQYLQSSNSSGWHYNGDDLWLPNYHGNGTLKILTHGLLEVGLLSIIGTKNESDFMDIKEMCLIIVENYYNGLSEYDSICLSNIKPGSCF